VFIVRLSVEIRIREKLTAARLSSQRNRDRAFADLGLTPDTGTWPRHLAESALRDRLTAPTASLSVAASIRRRHRWQPITW